MLAHEGRDSESSSYSLDPMFLFVGAMFVALGSSYTSDWFLAAFGPIIDGASDTYYTYQELVSSLSFPTNVKYPLQKARRYIIYEKAVRWQLDLQAQKALSQ